MPAGDFNGPSPSSQLAAPVHCALSAKLQLELHPRLSVPPPAEGLVSRLARCESLEGSWALEGEGGTPPGGD